ncbi:MAG TPA: DNA polymerase III subunit gamma/tau [Candidatus Saccharimonadales bacterium]|nr:DNA polymerase III subunit gamma/tau [Candidatus Saccharimonadales bacterium]
MAQVLYRKYRSKSFADVVGQEHITDTLQKAIKSGRISHAYLFTGPRGVGKTSVARILAHEVNGLPYEDESIHLDIIEIDAASNRRIEEIRDLRDKVHIAPTSAKYKVYIIDEVHMLTREAFNALLKTLEEPPEHCIFILATTEAHKLPETIISRTQRFEFKSIANASAVGHLAYLAKKEKIDIDKGALELLAEHGAGSFRDSIGLLDQLSASGQKITEQTVREFLGLPPAKLVQALSAAIESGDSKAALACLDELRDQGISAAATAKLLAKNLRQAYIASPQSWMGRALKDLIEVPASTRPLENLEIVVLEACAANLELAVPRSSAASVKSPEIQVKVAAPKIEIESPAKIEEVKKELMTEVAKPKKPRIVSELNDQAWEEIVAKVKEQAASLYTALRLATPEVADGKLTLAFQFPLHQKKVSQAQHRELIGQIVAQVTGQDLIIESVVDKSKKPQPKQEKKPEPKPVKTKPDNGSLESISNIFGEAEVIES